ncbi:hypothetical protein SpCBS45565_g04681 [Spizellomyces sp. 'palustris']|nr:hypothetical protein SpCBS45565_g04681 [Spizellomyces sp. 'palustris']
MALFRPTFDDAVVEPLLPDPDPSCPSEEPWEGSFRYVRNELISYVRSLICNSVVVPVKLSHILRSTEKAEEITRNTTERAGRASVYVTLLVCKQFRTEAKSDHVNRTLLESRGTYAEVLAILLLAQHSSDSLDVLKESLALTVAIEARATHFISDGRVNNTLMAIWRGSYGYDSRLTQGLQRHPSRIQARQMTEGREEIGHEGGKLQFRWWKLRVPRYQYYTSVFIYFIFLGLYTVVVNGRTITPAPAEIAMYIMVFSFIAEDVKSIFLAHRRFDALGMWNWIDYVSYFIFIVAFTFRLLSYMESNQERELELTDIAFNILSCSAVFVWFRTLELLDTFRNFGYLLVTVRRMLQDALHFFALIGILILGFTQAFHGLALGYGGGKPLEDPDRSSRANLPFILNMLGRSLMSDPAYDEAGSIHKFYGTILMHIFLFISYLVFMNLLIAVFNNSYDEVREKSEAEYQILLAEKILEHIQRSYEVPFLPPANLIELIFLPGLPVIGITRGRLGLEYICAALFIPEMLAIGVYEYFCPPQISDRMQPLTQTNVAFETWRLDIEVLGERSGGGDVGDGVEAAHAKAVDPRRRLSVGDNGKAPKDAMDRILKAVDGLDKRIARLEHDRNEEGACHLKREDLELIADLVVQKLKMSMEH